MINKMEKIKLVAMLMLSLLINNEVTALSGDQSIYIIDQLNYQQIISTEQINLTDSILTINSHYGLRNELPAIFAGVFHGITHATRPAQIVSNGNITAFWAVIENGNSLDLQFAQGLFKDVPALDNLKSLSAAIDTIANNPMYSDLIYELRSSSLPEYNIKLISLLPIPTINNEISGMQDIAISKVEQRLAELDNQYPHTYSAGDFFTRSLWIKPFISFAHQYNDIKNNITQHKQKTLGATIGMDELSLNNLKASGVSLSISRLKMYDYMIDSKASAYNLNALFYGKYVNKRSLFTQWIAGVGVSYSKQIRKSLLIDETAHTYTRWYVGSFQCTFGTQQQSKLSTAKLGVGALYTLNHNEAYKESGAILTALKVNSQNRHNIYAIAAFELSAKSNNAAEIFSINSYARLQYLLTSTKQKYYAKFIQVDNSEFKASYGIHRMYYKFGLNIKYESAYYDAIIGTDYSIHTSYREFTSYIKYAFKF
jgi:hypothetical protein